ncbi:hypothetical protein [Methylomonas fluvii]|uniref:Uncharacterized protein n=1 Tax=Methylomonas fluvii TaxID=1854564 RepID=A0ABR9DGX3_9GAMM|nr:hypothetical protein [Methylomonas fluvii]MBD9362354.1 hypothetical protein [Methylomonas fluvii]
MIDLFFDYPNHPAASAVFGICCNHRVAISCLQCFAPWRVLLEFLNRMKRVRIPDIFREIDVLVFENLVAKNAEQVNDQ